MQNQLVAWVLRAWPVLVIAILIVIHVFIVTAFPTHADVVNKWTGFILQVLGGLIVLNAVNQNLGLFRSQSLGTVVVAWFKEFPLRKQRASVVLVAGGSLCSMTGSASLTVKPSVNTLEERLAEVEHQIQEIRVLISTKEVELTSRIDGIKSELSSSIDSTDKTVHALTKKIEHATVGGFKAQAFGFMLVIYGAYVNVF